MAVFERILKDPVHDEVVVEDPWIWRLINTAAMQRLRRIRQLGTSYLTFHGAEHSRFSHSLGVYETMRRVLYHLDHHFGWPREQRDRRLALSVALLHDVGHGPFSHTFEKVYEFHHEDWTRRILLEDEEVQSVLREQDSTFAQDLVSVLDKNNQFPIIQQLISSQLDVDRMDYLLRDGLHTGVSYGNFELARLIRSLVLDGDEVSVRHSALHTVEQYILARYFMYTQVYLHPVTIGSDVLVAQILRRAQELVRQNTLPASLIPDALSVVLGSFVERLSVEDYLSLDEATLFYAFHQWSKGPDAMLADLAQRFLHRHLLYPIVCSKPSSETMAAVRTCIRASGYDPDYYLSGRTSGIAAYVYLGEGIQMMLPTGRREELSRMSRLVREMSTTEEYCLFLPREIFAPQSEMGERIQRLLKVSVVPQ
jgi:HD superfamily phosphohydrolase